ncbi:MAG: response regulator transcription factor [Chloroflexi bacterium]|nr:response regulator transcription factor [Chloroflexota bacterium]MCC6892287.1 response regulator transcription factor [Anaerolineae bacterium]
MVNKAKIKLLIVDDHPMVREGMVVLLESIGDFEVVGNAGDGETGIKLCREKTPDVVLMDMIMPGGMDGVTATRLMHEQCPDARVIAVTASKDETVIQNVMKAGAISYILKDASIYELAQAIRSAYNGKQTIAAEALSSLIASKRQPHKLGFDLTTREYTVLRLMMGGFNNREIAEQLMISKSTVKNHITHIFAKLNTKNRTRAIAIAIEQKLHTRMNV